MVIGNEFALAELPSWQVIGHKRRWEIAEKAA